jgi:hypothetical protein
MLNGWNFNQNFRRHQKAMDFFRLSHIKTPESAPVTPPLDSWRQPAAKTGLTGMANHFTDENGRIIVLPIWDVEMPTGSQN